MDYLLPVPKYDYDTILSEFSYDTELRYACKKVMQHISHFP